MLRELKGMTVGVVGGKGKMGSWLCSKLEEVGLKVMVKDKQEGKDLRSLARNSQIIILAIPFQCLRTVMEEMSPYMTRESLLMDIASIKEQPMKIMLQLSTGPVVGTHPLFGPESFNSPGLKVILCPGRGEKAIALATALWRRLGCKTSVLSAEEHDRIMGIAQGVFHFTSIVMAKLLHDAAPNDRSALNKASTANFQKALERIKSILSQPSWLFRDILVENRYSFLWIKRFLAEAQALADMLLAEDIQTYSSLFQRLGEVFKDEGDMGQDR